MISPDMYGEIDAIEDAKERPVDIYVKFVSVESLSGSIAGSTNISRGKDEDACNSKYGLHSVSVRIVTVKDALFLLAHEFGHIKYQVPNIASYRRFYENIYQDKTKVSDEIGHQHMDPSGQKACMFERNFRSKYGDFLRITTSSIDSPMSLMGEIVKELNHLPSLK